VFVLGLFGDLNRTLEMCSLIYHVPTEAQNWMTYEVPDLHEKLQRDTNWSELNQLKFKVCGMPLLWKFLNVMLVAIPKVYIWLLTVDIGVTFLMETAKIEDMIINSVALAFILSIDELIFDSLMPTMARYVMDQIQDFKRSDSTKKSYWAKDALNVHKADRHWNAFNPRFYSRAFPVRLFSIGAITGLFITKYYVESCRQRPDGSLVAKDVFLPRDDPLDWMSFFLGPIPGAKQVEVYGDAVWKMTYPPGSPELKAV